MHIHYIKDEYNEVYRLWQSTDPGDVFATIPIKEFERYNLPAFKNFPKLYVEDFPEADDGELICNLCKQEQAKATATIPKRRGRPRKAY